jgi:hypothetical protein
MRTTTGYMLLGHTKKNKKIVMEQIPQTEELQEL